MDLLLSKLIDNLFSSDSRVLIKNLKNLDTEQRKVLFKKFEKVFPVLRQACKYHQENTFEMIKNGFSVRYEPRIDNVNKIIPLVKNNLENLAEIFEKEKININSSKGTESFFMNLQLLQIGISDKKSIYSGLKFNFHFPGIYTQREEKDSFLTFVGEILLNRSEPWIKEVFIRFFESIEKWITFPFLMKGFASLILEIIKKYPEWTDDIRPFMGKAMYLDGFINKDLQRYTAEMILAGLDYEPANEGRNNFYPFPIISGGKNIIMLIDSGFLPKNEVTNLVLKKLSGNFKPNIIKAWIDLYKELNLTNDDIFERAESYIDLLNAVSSPVTQLAMKEIKPLIASDKLSDSETLIKILTYNLNNPVKKVAKESFLLIKNIIAKKSSLIVYVIQNIVENLSNSELGLRIEILEWVAGLKVSLSASSLAKLSEYSDYDGISPVETELLSKITGEKKISVISSENTIVDTTGVLKEQLNIDESEIKKYKKNFRNLKSILQTYLNSNELKPQQVVEIDNEEYLEDEFFVIPESAEKLAYLFTECMVRPVTVIDFEIFFASVMAFKNPQGKDKLIKILDPVISILNKWNKEDENTWTAPGSHEALFLAALAYAWIYDGATFCFSEKSLAKRSGAISYAPLGLQRRFVFIVNNLKSDTCISLLSPPTRKTGWLEHAQFAQRLLESQEKNINFEDLVLALLRLPASHDERKKAWDLLKIKVSKFDKYLKWALEIALAPNDILKEAIISFCYHFARNTPNDFILYRFYYGMEKKEVADKNMEFRLFNIALKSRFGLSNPLNEFPQLKQINLNKLALDQGKVHNFNFDFSNIEKFVTSGLEKLGEIISGNKSNDEPGIIENILSNFKIPDIAQSGAPVSTDKVIKLEEEELSFKEFISQLIFYPFPITKALKEQSLLQKLYLYDETKMFYYPQFVPYLYLPPHKQAGFGFLNNENQYIYGYIFNFPILAQRFFEAGIVRNHERIMKNDLTIGLIGVGFLPYVNIRPYLNDLLQFLTSKHSNHREKVVEILLEALKDGRISFTDITENLSQLIYETSAGFKYLKEAVESIASSGKVYEKMVIMVIEEVLAKDFETMNSANVSVLADLLHHLLVKYKRGIENKQAVANIGKSLEVKKKKGYTEKLRLLFLLKGKNTFLMAEAMTDMLAEIKKI